ncbi:MAG: tRNA 2-methylthio-N6-isopentenyl adenosine(37) hydroxylase MiaE [Chitinophagia bacterium]|nr:tRNA 2-methylthio-N6-isopentenyl adenosine(37) hydroxylase MiaE [Chitinophagia bacterium]
MNTTLGLKLPTDPRWVNLAAVSEADILADHAFCEQKAATQCISLIQMYGEKTELVNRLAPIVTEEWGHFRLVLWELQKRGYSLGKQRKDEYVNGLMEHIPKAISPADKLLHKLLLCALIEARSCERFRILSLHLADEYLRNFYHKFMVAEAGHYRLFIELAEHYYGEEQVNAAWEQWLAIEVKVLAGLAPRGDRMH